MTRDRSTLRGGYRRLALAGIGLLGVISIVGSGGGDPAFFEIGPRPEATIEPPRQTAQVGTAVTFTVRVSNLAQPFTYRWSRLRKDGSTTYENIAGATSATLTLAAVNLTDDGALFRAEASGDGGGFAAYAYVGLAVSSMPGVVFQDGDFQPSGWTVVAISDPAQDGPTHAESRVDIGGNLGAYRSMTMTLQALPASIRVFHSAQAALYDPATQGAIDMIDFTEDCLTPEPSKSKAIPWSAPMLEQAGRRFIAVYHWRLSCRSYTWVSLPARAWLGAQDFELADGSACGSGEACPDFSIQGAPIRLGYVTGTEAPLGTLPGTLFHGIDNWTATVWRK